jgi:hypothetical protein
MTILAINSYIVKLELKMIAVIFKATLSEQLLTQTDLISSSQEEFKRYLKMAETLRNKALGE